MTLAFRIAIWMIVLLVPGGVLALPLLLAQHARKEPVAPGLDAPPNSQARLTEA